MNLGFSKTLALIFGTALPLMGIVRSFIAKGDPAGFFEDLIAGAFLLFGAWQVGISKHSGQRYLAAAWGLVLGLLYSDLYAQIQAITVPQIVEVRTPIPPGYGIAISVLSLLCAAVGLITCLRSTRKN